MIGEPDDLVKRNPYRYAGYRYDRETQYYYLRVRYYDGRLGRFLSQDTWAGDVRKPLTLNRYIYAVNNPVNYVDPNGRTPLCGDDGSDGNVICLDDGERLVSPASRRYSGRGFTVPPLGPSGDQRPNREQTEFIRYLYDIGEESDYGPRTQNAVAGLQRAHEIPVDGQVMIGPRTWELLVREFERRLGAFEASGHVDGQYGARSTVKQVDMSFMGRQTLSVTAADDQKMSGMSPTTRTSYLLCLQEEADLGASQAPGCFMQWPERFGTLSDHAGDLIGMALLDAAAAGLSMSAPMLSPVRGREIPKDHIQDILSDSAVLQLEKPGASVQSQANAKADLTSRTTTSPEAPVRLSSLDDVFANPSRLLYATVDDIRGLAVEAGWQVGPLKQGRHKGQGFTAWKGDLLIQFHPGGGSHGSSPYWKVSSGKHGTRRIPLVPSEFR